MAVGRARRMVVLALGAAVLALATLASTAASGRAPMASSASFQDPAADQQSGGPDLRDVTVANDDAGTLTFTLGVANRPALGATDFYAVFVDADQNQATGNVSYDYLITFDGSGDAAELLRWNGSDWVPGAGNIDATYSGGPLLTLPSSALGSPGGFAFLVLAGTGPDQASAAIDWAPNELGEAPWVYQVVLAATTPPPAPTAPGTPPAPGAPPVAEAPPTGAQADTLGPAMSVLTGRQRMHPKGTLTINVQCPASEQRCRGGVSLRTALALTRAQAKALSLTALAGKRPKLASGSFDVAGGAQASVQIRLSARAQAIVRGLGSLMVEVTVSATDAAGNTGRTVKPVRVRAPLRG